jgi:hypothetical protein
MLTVITTMLSGSGSFARAVTVSRPGFIRNAFSAGATTWVPDGDSHPQHNSVLISQGRRIG